MFIRKHLLLNHSEVKVQFLSLSSSETASTNQHLSSLWKQLEFLNMKTTVCGP
jgi:hypothetical protein